MKLQAKRTRPVLLLSVAVAIFALAGCKPQPSAQELAIEKYNEANGLEERGKYEAAIEAYSEAIRINPKYGQCHF